MKILDGRELAGFIKERQAHQVRGMSKKPKLLIVRDSDDPVILKYVNLKVLYGADIGIMVEDYKAKNFDDLEKKITAANSDPSVSGIIVQLPIKEKERTDELCNLINPDKDVDGLGEGAKFDSATATAISWLLNGYNIELKNQRIAIVGRGKLVGAPLLKMFCNSGLDVELFHRGSDLSKLNEYDVIITATGVSGLINSSMIKPGAVVVDAGTASEDGVLKGDLTDDVRDLTNLSAITPKTGGVGPLTIACLFEHTIAAGAMDGHY